ncbi:MAG: MBL fold metallo-hydrolase [Planctomycetaceae bacterium]|nr:MBL fold metallo-hydrolase [Planctomycetaceae bacterium]
MFEKITSSQDINSAKRMLLLMFFLLLNGFSLKIIADDQLPGLDSSEANQVVMKVQEATFPVTEENGATKRVMIVSKIFDAKESYGNSYIVRHVGRTGAIVIDPGYNYEAIIRYLKSKDCQLEAILLTNGYFARMAGNAELKRHWPEAKILIGEADAKMLTDIKANMSEEFGGVTPPKADIPVRDGDRFDLAGIHVWAISMPGHTPGSTCYMIDSDKSPIVFTGDFIYKDGISSADLPISNQEDMQKSLQAFFESQYAETVIFSGYGDDTTVGAFYEKLTGTPIDAAGTSTTIQADAVQEPLPPQPLTIDRTQTVPGSSEPQPAVTNVMIDNRTVYVPPVQYATSEILLSDFSYPWFRPGIGVRVPFVTFWVPVRPSYSISYMPPRVWSFRIGPYPYPTYFYPYSSRSHRSRPPYYRDYRNNPPYHRDNPYRDRRDYDSRIPMPQPNRNSFDRGGFTPPISGTRPGSTHPGATRPGVTNATVTPVPGTVSGQVRDRVAKPENSGTRPGSMTPKMTAPKMTVPGNTTPNRPGGNKPSLGGGSISSGSAIPKPDLPGRGTTAPRTSSPGTAMTPKVTTTPDRLSGSGRGMGRESSGMVSSGSHPRSNTTSPVPSFRKSDTGSNDPGHGGKRGDSTK